jgi:hypothetical protein
MHRYDTEKMTCLASAQGIEAEIPEAPKGLRNWSGKPGPAQRAGCAHLRMMMLYDHFLTVQNNKKSYAFILRLLCRECYRVN